MRRRIAHVVACLVLVAAGSAVLPGTAPAEPSTLVLERQQVFFEVHNPLENNATRRIAGYQYDPPGCKASTVVLLQHGLSYTKEAWDFPGYSVAQALARGGYSVVAIDRLGYGESKLDNGYNVSSEAYAAMAHEIADHMHHLGFTHVVLGGHSAGSEVTELTAGLYGGADALLVLGYHHRPSDQLGQDFFTGDNPRALADDYEYFLGAPEHRSEMFFTGAADPKVVQADRDAAVLTPSGEILSIGKQPSGKVLANIKAPVYYQIGDSDRLFEAKYNGWEKMQFAQAKSFTIDLVAQAGHTQMLHPTGPAATDRMVQWLRSQESAPPCN